MAQFISLPTVSQHERKGNWKQVVFPVKMGDRLNVPFEARAATNSARLTEIALNFPKESPSYYTNATELQLHMSHRGHETFPPHIPPLPPCVPFISYMCAYRGIISRPWVWTCTPVFVWKYFLFLCQAVGNGSLKHSHSTPHQDGKGVCYLQGHRQRASCETCLWTLVTAFLTPNIR